MEGGESCLWDPGPGVPPRKFRGPRRVLSFPNASSEVLRLVPSLTHSGSEGRVTDTRSEGVSVPTVYGVARGCPKVRVSVPTVGSVCRVG